ncbi:MAG: sensor histidine kinase N-terminal domain-containing protein, partial [Burkholderiales bacterium]|nr:sensor histidine kinase N-terminal domain-containing protein [Burkholderiales bacterium]
LAGPLIVMWSISTMVDYDIAKRFVNFAYDRALLDAALDIGRQVKVLNDRIYVDLPEVAVKMLQTRESGKVFYLVTGPKNEYITGEPDLPQTPHPESGRTNYYDDEYLGRPVRVVTLQLPVETGKDRGYVTVQVVEDRAPRAEFAGLILLRMMLPQVALVLLAGILVWYAIGRGLVPLSVLRSEIESRSHRDLSALSEEQVPNEVRPLIRAMNGLLQRLSKTLAAQQRFIADAAHQLRTPMAGIKTQTELALRQAPPDESQATLRQLNTATEQTIRLINQLLSLARAEPAAERAHTGERVDLTELARDAAADWVPRALARQIDLGLDSTQAPATMEGDAFLLREMLNNLLDNAIRYTQTGGQVTVRVAVDIQNITLTVEDNGPGIPESERERVFERFYRVLGTGVEGCGLGLAIVHEIAQRHNAEVALGPRAGGSGTAVKVTFPRSLSDLAPTNS